MDLRKVEEIVKDPKGGIVEKKKAIASTISDSHSREEDAHSDSDSDSNSNRNDGEREGGGVDSATALQLFLDHIPISSIPGIPNSPSTPVLEVRTEDSVKEVIMKLWEKNVGGALIGDISGSDPVTVKTTAFSHPYLGFIHFPSLFLWALPEFQNHRRETEDDEVNGDKKVEENGFFSLIDQIPIISDTKIGELAKSFLWDPVFLVNLEQTLFHVLLLLSKHRLSVLPVTERSSSKVIGFITENSVNHVLLQSSGLEWFDSIAEKPLSDFRFEQDDRVVCIYEDKSVAKAMRILWHKKVCAVAVVQRQTQMLIGCVRTSDVHHLLNHDDLFANRENVTVGQFIHIDTSSEDRGKDQELGALESMGTLVLKNKFVPKMDSPVMNRKTDTLKQAMADLAESRSSFSFLVDEGRRVRGILTLRDVIVEFAPPCMDSRIDGGGFFDLALSESGCTIKGGAMVHVK